MTDAGQGSPGRDGRVPTWRDGVPPLTRRQLESLTPEQRDRYLHDSLIRDLAEIEQLPEPWRTRVQGMVDRARADAESRVAKTEGRQAS